MGILNFLKKNKKAPRGSSDAKNEVTFRNPDLQKEHDELQIRLAKQDAILKKANKARENYEIDGDVDKLFSVYQEILDTEPYYQIRGNWIFKYPELLIKEKRYDQAWGVLNRLYLDLPDSHGRIRDMQFQILKAENRHPQDAIHYLMVSYLLKMKGVINPVDYWEDHERTSFIKKAKTTAKKAGFSEEELNSICDIIESCILENCFSETQLHNKYEKFLKSRS